LGKRRETSRLAGSIVIDMRPRRFIGIVERAILGTAMSVVLYVVERRLSRRQGAASTRPDRRSGEGGT
jgi:hypothetical protein